MKNSIYKKLSLLRGFLMFICLIFGVFIYKKWITESHVLIFAYSLLGITFLLVSGFSLAWVIRKGFKTKQFFIPLIIFCSIIAFIWILTSFIHYEPVNVATNRFTDIGIITFYLLLFAAFIFIVYSEIIKIFQK